MDAQLPLISLGDSGYANSGAARLPISEEAFLKGLNDKFPERFFECYFELRRSSKWTMLEATCGAWLALGKKDRRGHTTQEALAGLINRRREWVSRTLANAELQAQAQKLRMAFWDDRIPDIDQAVFEAALSPFGNAGDRKLAYQRARVPLSGEDSAPAEKWKQMLEEMRKEGATGDV